MEQFPDLSADIPDIPDEFNDKAGLIVPDLTQSMDPIDQYAYPIADDILYNILHSLVLDVHRNERIARSLTAGIIVSQLARDKYPPIPPSRPTSPTSAPSTPKKRRHYPQHIETEAAVYEDGIVTIKGNPLVKVREIRCPKCGLEKLLHPTTGNGAREPPRDNPGGPPGGGGKEYCRLEPYVEREGYDIYGLPFPKDDVSNSKKKDRAPEKVGRNGVNLAFGSGDGADSSFESSAVGDSPPPAQQEERKEDRKVVFPNVECPRCPRMVNVRVFARHLNGHLKTGGRASRRAAAARISGGNEEKRSDKEKSGNVTPAAIKEEKEEKKSERSPKKRDRERDANEEYRPAKRTSLPDSISSRSEASSKSSSSSGRPTTGGKGNIFGPALTRRELEERAEKEKAAKQRSEPQKSKRELEREAERAKEREEKEERDKERRRIMQREMDRQREREIATNKLFMAAKRRWPDRVVKKWKSGKVTVDGRVWEGDRR